MHNIILLLFLAVYSVIAESTIQSVEAEEEPSGSDPYFEPRRKPGSYRAERSPLIDLLLRPAGVSPAGYN